MREKKEVNVKIGNQIRMAREAAGLTQDRFAEMVSLAPKNVSDIERGVVGISIGNWYAFVKHLLFPVIPFFSERHQEMM